METGEICVCGPAVFAGYYDNPEANAKAFRDGWFRTGDLGHMDAEGFLYITGRASDMYISGGSNVYPREIEEKMLTHPAIAEVAILGVADQTWGEVGVAVCVLRPDAQLNEKELLAWMEGKVSRYKLPKRVFFWEALPKSGYGKITKKPCARSWRRAGSCRSTSRGRLPPSSAKQRAALPSFQCRRRGARRWEKGMHPNGTVFVTGGASGIGLAIVRALLDEGRRVRCRPGGGQPRANPSRARRRRGADSVRSARRHGRGGCEPRDRSVRCEFGADRTRQLSRHRCRRGLPGDQQACSARWSRSISSAASWRRARPPSACGRAPADRSSTSLRYLGCAAIPDGVAYGCSKAAVIHMTKVMAVELGPSGIRSMRSLGPVETPLVKEVHTDQARGRVDATVPQRRYGTPDELAGAATFLLDERKSSYITGQTICVDGGFTAAGIMAGSA